MDSKSFRQALGQFATGVTVVISRYDDGALHGMTVNSFTSVSLNPPLVLFCADNRSDTFKALSVSRRFTVSMLTDKQETLSRRFAVTGPQDALFQSLACQPGIDDIPYLADALAFLDCAVENIIPAGDHHLVLARVDELGLLSPGHPLIYFQSGYHPLT